MQFLIYGAGAVGGYFGALLVRGGHEVTFVARGANLAALQTQGLTIRLGAGPETIHLPSVRAVARPEMAPRPDAVLVCVKSYDTPVAAAALRTIAHPDIIILSLQNGIENEGVLAAALDLPPLLVAFTRIGVELVAPATILYSGRGTIVFGEPDGSVSPRARQLADAFGQADVPYELRRDVLVGAWEKLAWNAGFNAVTTLTHATASGIIRHPASRALLVEAMEEVDAVAMALGVQVRRDRIESVLAETLAGLPDFATSMQQDYLRGKRIEWDALNGAVVRAAARAGVPVPVNRALAALLARLDPAAAPAS